MLMHEWKTIRSTDRFDDMELDLIQRCARCHAGRRLIRDADGNTEVIFVDPNPLPPCASRSWATPDTFEEEFSR